MATQHVRDDSPQTRHSVRVDWFRREPGGTTIFVKPTDDLGRAARQAADDANHT